MQTLKDYWFRELVTSPPNETVRVAATKMEDRRVGCVLVTEDDKVLGIATRYDFIHGVIVAGKDPEKTTIRQIMHASPISIESSATTAEALRKMIEKKVERLVVRSGQKILGVISMEDVVSKLDSENMLRSLSGEKYKQIFEMIRKLTPYFLARYDAEEKEELRREMNDEAKALLRLLEEVEISLRP